MQLVVTEVRWSVDDPKTGIAEGDKTVKFNVKVDGLVLQPIYWCGLGGIKVDVLPHGATNAVHSIAQGLEDHVVKAKCKVCAKHYWRQDDENA